MFVCYNGEQVWKNMNVDEDDSEGGCNPFAEKNEVRKQTITLVSSI